jgi:hypothetical protein
MTAPARADVLGPFSFHKSKDPAPFHSVESVKEGVPVQDGQ